MKITAKDLSSLEKSKAIISNLTMVPTVGDIYRNCEIKSIAPYGVFVEIAPGREGLCHISELTSNWLAKAEDAVKVGDRIDVKLIEVNDKGQLRLSRRVLLPNTEPDSPNVKQQTDSSTKDIVASQKAPGKGSAKKVVNVPKDGLAEKNIEQLEDKISTPNLESAPESNPSEDDAQLPQKKFIRRLVSPARDRPDTNKDKSKGSSKAVSSVSSKDENSLVNGEAKIG